MCCVCCVCSVCAVCGVWAGEPQPAPDKDRDPQAAAIGRASLLRRVQASCNPKLIFVCGGCWVGDPEVEFVTTFLGHLPGLSCCGTSSAGRGTGLSRIELEESYSDQFLAGQREPSPQTFFSYFLFVFYKTKSRHSTNHIAPTRSCWPSSRQCLIRMKNVLSLPTRSCWPSTGLSPLQTLQDNNQSSAEWLGQHPSKLAGTKLSCSSSAFAHLHPLQEQVSVQHLRCHPVWA